ncbi:general substrate transporter [Aspergillus karnatakaensis]|uniref:general substrate transporter n=1 Tax=Aspergillus karnatakaensis TaxID=1810916 RepID=UPI003CCDEA0C
MKQAEIQHLLQTAFVVFPCFFLFGYNQVVVGALVSFEAFTKSFPELDTKHVTGALKSDRSVIQGVYVSSFTLGAAAGASSCSFIGDRLGRRKTICIGAILTLIGEALSCSSFDLPQLFIGRIITGMGVGIFSATVPVWQSESSQALNRGRHVVIDGIFITSGYAVSYWINFGFSKIQEDDVSWRIPLAIPSLLSILLSVSIFFFPESPRWLVQTGNVGKAASELARIKRVDKDAEEITLEIHAVSHSLEITAASTSSVKNIFTMQDGKLFYRCMLCIGLQFWIQMTGAQVISTYSTTIFQNNLNLSDGVTRILAASAMTWKFLSSFISLFTIDTFGRRKLFIVCGVGITTCMTCMAIMTSFSADNRSAAIASTLFVFLFNFFFPIGFLGPSFLYCTEVASSRLRVAMTSISTANHWLWNFLVQMVTPVALSSIGYKFYIVFAIIGLTYVVSVYFLYPETMGQSLERLEDLFQKDLSVLETVKVANRLQGVSSDEEIQAHNVKGKTVEIEHAV